MDKKSVCAMFTGSFDPVTLGHEDIIRRAAALFDRLYVTAFINKDKEGLFPPALRLAFLEKVCADLPNVTVCRDDGMVADFVTREGIDLIVRSVRGAADADYERTMADYNKEKCGVETLLFCADPRLAHISSTAVREALLRGEDAHGLLPACIWEDVAKNLQSLQKKTNKD